MAGAANLLPVDNNINSKPRSWRKPTAAPLGAFNQGVNLAGLNCRCHVTFHRDRFPFTILYLYLVLSKVCLTHIFFPPKKSPAVFIAACLNHFAIRVTPQYLRAVSDGSEMLMVSMLRFCLDWLHGRKQEESSSWRLFLKAEVQLFSTE